MRKSVSPVWSQVIDAPSGGARVRKRPPKGMSALLFKDPAKASATFRQPTTSLDTTDYNDPSAWVNTTWNFYWPVPDGIENHIWSAQLIIRDNLAFELFLYVEETYGGQTCDHYVLDHITGTMQINTDPELTFILQGTGDEQLVDSCNPALNYDNPVDLTLSWVIRLYYPDGSAWQFINNNYQYPFNNYIMRQIPNAFTTAKPLTAKTGGMLLRSGRRSA